ncbi:hypothetical protein H9P43_009376 [Blastocladiella emersonii ATCC 22665]|nr:hypothetical protein H9P43_009376 [Blastocladiella emersonii ATCC 22665]
MKQMKKSGRNSAQHLETQFKQKLRGMRIYNELCFLLNQAYFNSTLKFPVRGVLAPDAQLIRALMAGFLVDQRQFARKHPKFVEGELACALNELFYCSADPVGDLAKVRPSHVSHSHMAAAFLIIAAAAHMDDADLLTDLLDAVQRDLPEVLKLSLPPSHWFGLTFEGEIELMNSGVMNVLSNDYERELVPTSFLEHLCLASAVTWCPNAFRVLSDPRFRIDTKWLAHVFGQNTVAPFALAVLQNKKTARPPAEFMPILDWLLREHKHVRLWTATGFHIVTHLLEKLPRDYMRYAAEHYPTGFGTLFFHWKPKDLDPDFFVVLDKLGLLMDWTWGIILQFGLAEDEGTGTSDLSSFAVDHLGSRLTAVLVEAFRMSILDSCTDGHSATCVLLQAYRQLGREALEAALPKMAAVMNESFEFMHQSVDDRARLSRPIALILDHLLTCGERRRLSPPILFRLANEFLALVRSPRASEYAGMAWLPVVVLGDEHSREAAIAQVRAKGTATTRVFLVVLLEQLFSGQAKTMYSPFPREETRRCTLETHAAWGNAMDDLYQLLREANATAAWFPADCASSVRLIAQAKGRTGLQGRIGDELAEYPNGVCPRYRAPVVPRVQQAFRFVLRTEPKQALAEIAAATALPLEFWWLVPDGALDGVKDGKWVMKMARSVKREFGGEAARDVFREIRRVAPKTVAGPVESVIAALEGQ